MMNFIKYNRLKLRDQEYPCFPQGPDFRSAKKYSYDLQGNQVRFLAPNQIHLFRPGSERFSLKWGEDDLSSLRTGSDPTKTWGNSLLFLRNYAFYGPWFSGELARTSFGMCAIAPMDFSNEVNLLHPRAFEVALAGYLTAEYGFYEWEGSVARYTAPIEWTPIKNLPVPAAKFLVLNKVDRHRHVHFCFPISSNRILLLVFSYEQYAGGNIAEMDAAISPKPAQDLIDNIINSVELVPSPELEKELEEVRRTCPDLSVREEFPPLQWPATVDETGLNIVELDENKRKELAGL